MKPPRLIDLVAMAASRTAGLLRLRGAAGPWTACLRLALIGMALSCLAIAPRSAQAPGPGSAPREPKTSFKPSRDFLQMANPSGPGWALGGSCEGLVNAALVYFKYGATQVDITGKRPPALSEIGEKVRERDKRRHFNEKDDDIRHPLKLEWAVRESAPPTLRRFAQYAQNLVYDQPLQERFIGTRPRDLAMRLRRSLDAGEPMIVGLHHSANGNNHAVVVYDYEITANGNIRFKVGDPNRPGEDNLTLTFSEKPLSDSGAEGGDFSAWPYSSGLQKGWKVDSVNKPSEWKPHLLLRAIKNMELGIKNPIPTIVPRPGQLRVKDEFGEIHQSEPEGSEVGGVLFRFPRELAAGDMNSAEARDLLKEMKRAAMGKESFVVQTKEETAQYVVVPLRQVLEDNRDPPLTTLEGSILDEAGHLWLVGRKSAGKPFLRLDDLTVAAAAILFDGSTPFLSLDPDPNGLYGPQSVRVGGLRPEHRASGFVKSMLDADYLMKRIMLGEVRPGIDGFQSAFDLRLARRDVQSAYTRYWLTPRQYEGVDTFSQRLEGPGQPLVLLFRSGVCVQTESMRLSAKGLVSSGKADGLSQDAASSMTTHFNALADVFPDEFGRLQQAFEAGKWAALLASLSVESTELTALAARPVKSNPIPETMPLVGPHQVGDLPFVVAGGAVAEYLFCGERVAELTFAVDLAKAAHPSISGMCEVKWPRVLPFGAKATAQRKSIEADLAMKCFAAGDFESSRHAADRALEIDGKSAVALTARALAYHMLGRFADALSDQQNIPDDKRSVVSELFAAASLAALGQEQSALQRLNAAGPISDLGLLRTRGSIRLMACDFAGAERDVREVLSLDPLDIDARQLLQQLETLNRQGPVNALEIIARTRTVAPHVSGIIMDAEAVQATGDLESALQHWFEAARTVTAHKDHPGVRTYATCELVLVKYAQCLDAMAAEYLQSAKQLERARAEPESILEAREAAEVHSREAISVLEQLAKVNPEWASLRMLRATIRVSHLAEEEAATAIITTLSHGSIDPLMKNLSDSLGTPLFLQWLALNAAVRIADSGVRARVVDAIVASLKGSDFGPLVRAVTTLVLDVSRANAMSVCRALEALPVRLAHTDAFGLALVSLAAQHGISNSLKDSTADRETLLNACAKVIALTSRDQIPPAAIAVAARAQAGLLSSMVLLYLRPLDAGADSLTAAIDSGRLSPVEAMRQWNSLVADMEESVRRDIRRHMQWGHSEFVEAWLLASLAFYCADYELNVIQHCEDSLDPRTKEYATRKIEAESWRASATSRNLATHVQPSGFDRVVQSAQEGLEVQLQAVSLWMQSCEAPAHRGSAVLTSFNLARIKTLKEIERSRFQRNRMVRLNWSGFPTPQDQLALQSAPHLPGKSGEESRGLWRLVLLAGAGTALIGLAWLLFAFRRARRGRQVMPG